MDVLRGYGSDSDSETDSDITAVNNDHVNTCDTSNSKSTSEAYNFFGLSGQGEAKDQANSVSGKTEVHKQDKNFSVTVDGQSIAVEIPGTEFWNGIESTEVQNLQQQSKMTQKRTLPLPSFEAQNHRFTPKKIKQESRACVSSKPVQTSKPDNTQRLSGGGASTHCVAGHAADREQGTWGSRNMDRNIFYVHSKITPHLHTRTSKCRVPTAQERSLTGHAGAVNRLQWNIPSYSHLLASCSMDATVKVWNVWSQLDPCVRVVTSHSRAVHDVQWGPSGQSLLTCSYDKTANMTDVEKGAMVRSFQHSSYVRCGKFQPANSSVCVTGGHNELTAWDSRTPDVPCKTFQYKDYFGQVQDVVFKPDGGEFFTCSDVVTRDSADRTLMAWDFRTGVTLSNQIYQERYVLNRLKIHPTDGCLLAQSNGNYVAIFSKDRPFKINKSKRFEGHKLLGYSVGFDISRDGTLVVSGSSDGSLHCYNYQTGRRWRTLQTDLNVAMDVVCHPVLPSTLAVCGWDGNISVWK